MAARGIGRDTRLMATAWFYWADNQQHGPVSEDALKSMAAAGTLRPEDLVRNESTEQWLPAGQATDWTFGRPPIPAAPLAGPGPAAPLAYAAPAVETLVISPRVLDLLQRTSPWVRFFAVLSYIVAGLLALGGVGIIVLSFARFTPPDPAGVIGGGLAYFLIAVIYVFAAGYLNRYASGIQRLARMKRNIDLEDALDAQRGFWKFSGILAICGFVLWVLIAAIAIALR